MKTTNYVQEQWGQIRLCQKPSKRVCTGLKIKSLDRWNNGTLVPGWWENGKSTENESDTTLSVKRGGGNVMAWLCMADGGTRSLVLTDDEAEGWILKWLYCLIIFSRMLLNWSYRSNLKVKKWYVLQWPDQSPDLKPTEHALELLNTKLNVERPIQAVTECEGSLGLSAFDDVPVF